MPEIDVETAIRYYKTHLKNVSDYQKRHPDRMRAKNKEYNQKVKENNPEKYQEILAKKKEYYHSVRKPKLAAERASKNVIPDDAETKTELVG